MASSQETLGNSQLEEYPSSKAVQKCQYKEDRRHRLNSRQTICQGIQVALIHSVSIE